MTGRAGTHRLADGIRGMVAVVILTLPLACNTDRQPGDRPGAGARTNSTSHDGPTYVGREQCARCHTRENDLWRGSDHDLAMQPAAPATVLGDFDDASFTWNGVTSRFRKERGRYMVRTEGADGRLHDYEVLYTFGHRPLQQYLVQFPDGRLQALGIAWDSRPAAEGGQRWFHLYPEDTPGPTDPLHWTQPAQNWNHMCADCHSTNVDKNYDTATHTFDTRWSEINVACEACHGPGSDHVVWAEARQARYESHEDFTGTALDAGLVVDLADRDGGRWVMTDSSDTAVRVPPRTRHDEIESCAPCHARRLTVSKPAAGDRFLDNHRLALMSESLYHPDGQIRDEVFVYGSFVQSRMFHAGVTCKDCHDPHSLSVGFAADMACYQCHVPNTYADTSHHFHEVGSEGASCVACHMPETTYMVVDPRRDHAIGNPRPDLSLALGVPNACNRCHADQDAQWAWDAYRRWWDEPDHPATEAALAMVAGYADSLRAAEALGRVILDDTQSAFVRASAVVELGNHMTAASARLLRNVLGDPDPLLRLAAVQAASGIPPENRLPYLLPLLVDPVPLVRAEAASRLAGSDLSALPAEAAPLLQEALQEYVAMQEFNADRVESHLNLGILALQRGDAAGAEASYRTALQLEPRSVPAAINLADLYQQLGQEEACATLLEKTLEGAPDNVDVLHALGLQRIRVARTDEALVFLESAARGAPENARYSYVWGVALHSTGEAERGIAALEEAHALHPNDIDVLLTLTSYVIDAGDSDRARRHLGSLEKLLPQHPAVLDLQRRLEARTQ